MTPDHHLATRSLLLFALPLACGLFVGMPDDPQFGSEPERPGGNGGSAGDHGEAGDAGSREPGAGMGGVAGTNDVGGNGGNAAGTGGTSGGTQPQAGAGGGDAGGGAGDGGDAAGSGGDGPTTGGGIESVRGSIYVPPGEPKSSAPLGIASRRAFGGSAPELDVFWVTRETAEVSHVTYSGERFSPPRSLGGNTTFAPVVAASAADRLDVFIVTPSNTIQTRPFAADTWLYGDHEWLELGGDAAQGLAATADGEVVHAFAVAGDGTVRYLEWRHEMTETPVWQPLDGARSDGGVSVVTPRPDYTAVFIRDNGVLYEKWLLGGIWYPASGWQPITPSNDVCNYICPCHQLGMDPTVVSSGQERADVIFFADTLYNLRWRASDGWNCERLDAPTLGPPVATVRDTHRFDVFWLTPPDGDLMGKSWRGADWSSQYPLGASFTDIATASTGPDAVFVFGRLSDGAIAYRKWRSAEGWLPK